MKPIDMVLHCPNCGMQHIDAPESDEDYRGKHLAYGGFDNQWTNPPHKSHLCHGCGCIWRPADVPTNGVQAVKTRGKADTWPAGVKGTTTERRECSYCKHRDDCGMARAGDDCGPGRPLWEPLPDGVAIPLKEQQ